MASHDWWHLVVLGSTLMGAAGLGIMVLGPLIFDELPPGLEGARPLIWGLIFVAGVLLVSEWLLVH